MKLPADFDTARLLRDSRFRVGSLRARGIPAVLLGVGAIVLANGAMRALTAGAPVLPEIVREFRALLESNRRSQPLNP